MDLNILTLVIAIVALLIGIVAGKFIFAKDTQKRIDEAEQHAQKLIKEAELRAETVRKEKELAAKERFVQLKSDHDREINDRNRKISQEENRIKQEEARVKQKEQGINHKIEQLEKQAKENDAIKQNLTRQIEVVTAKQQELERHQEEHLRRLEKISNLTAEEAKAQLIEGLKQEAHSQALALQQDIIDDAKAKANKEARKIVIQSI